MCDMTHSYLWHDIFTHMTWRSIIGCDMTHSYVWRDAFTREITRSYVWHDVFALMTRHIHMFDMMHSYIRVPRRIHECDMTHLYVRHDVRIWRIHMCAMMHSHVWHDAFICVPWANSHSLSHAHLHTRAHTHMVSFPNKTKQNKTKQNKKASRLSRVKDISKLGHLHLQALLLRFTQADTSGEVFLRCVLERCNVLQCVAVWCSVLQCVVVCCSVSSWYL